MAIAKTARNQLRCPKCRSNLLHENLDGDLECADCGKVLYKQPYGIALEADKISLPQQRPKGILTIQPKTRGRKREGEWKECKICREPIYIRPYRMKLKRKTNGEYCGRCFRRVILPILARLPRTRSKVNLKLTTKQPTPMVPSVNVNTRLTEQELALRCLQCSSLKSPGGIFRCSRQRCKYD